MKNKTNKTVFFLWLLIVCSGFVNINFVFAENVSWEADIYAQGEDFEGVKDAKITIGVKIEPETLLSPPPPVDYSVKMDLYGKNWEGPFYKNIQKQDKLTCEWIISINPGGNIMPPDSRTSMVRWDPSQFGQGEYELREGTEPGGNIVVPNMRLTTYYEVTGENTAQFFLLVYKPGLSLDDAIEILRVMVGIPVPNLSFKTDINQDGRAGMAEVICILQNIAGLRD